MQYQKQEHFKEKGQRKQLNYMALPLEKQNFNNSLSIHDSKQFQFFDFQQQQISYDARQNDHNRMLFVQSPINKIKSQVSIKQNYYPQNDKDNQEDMQVKELANILNQQHIKKNRYWNSNGTKEANKYSQYCQDKQQTQYKNSQTQLGNKYKILRDDYEKLQSQYRKVKNWNQNLRTEKSNLMNQNIFNTKKMNHNYEQKMTQLNNTIGQLQAKVYQLEMGDIISNSRSVSGQNYAQTGRNYSTNQNEVGVIGVNPFYLQQLQRSNQHLKRQNKRLNDVLMHKMKNSFKSMY